MKKLITFLMLLFLAPPISEKKVEAENPFGEIKEQCEWAGETFNPGDTIRPDLWCILTCEPTGDWRVDCES